MTESEQKHIYLLTNEKSIFFLHYISDIFIVWTKFEKQIKDFMNEGNQIHSSLKIDYKFNSRQIEFLDALLYIYIK